MKRIAILHITDIHFGQAAMEGRWPTIRAQFFADLEHVLGQVGRIHLIALTGDISNRGLANEYADASRFLEEMGLFFIERNMDLPRLAPVPGNHDLVRPPRRQLAQIVLEESWSPEIAQQVLDPDSELKDFVADLFANYTHWTTQQPLPLIDVDHTGLMPGEYSGAVSVDSLRCGVVGLNSTFRHLSDRAEPGSLSIIPTQINAACGGDLPRWAKANSITIALSHHPTHWISEEGEVQDALFNPAGGAQLHLCGHLHQENYKLTGLASTGSYVTHQGQSLFGLEQWGTPPQTQREHGYAVLTLDAVGNDLELRVWPRGASKLQTGQWQLDRKADFGLKRGEESSSPISLGCSGSGSKGPHVETSILAAPANQEEAKRELDRYDPQFFKDLSAASLCCVVGERRIVLDHADCLPLPALRAGLWEALALGGEDDGTTPLEQLISLVASRSAKRARELTAYYLGNTDESAIRALRSLLRAPWSAFIYLTPLADLEPAIAEDDELSKRYTLFDSQSAGYRIPSQQETPAIRIPRKTSSGGVIELVTDPYHDSVQGDASRHWQGYVDGLLARMDVLFMADDISSPGIWRRIASRAAGKPAMQGRAYLVCPELPPQYAAALPLFRVGWFKCSVEEFTSDVLIPERQEFATGLARLSRRRSTPTPRPDLSVDGSLRAAGEGSRDYLLGRSPTWGDIVNGFAAELSLAQTVIRASEGDSASILIAAGTAGSGRTTALMQSALALRGAGQAVGWIDRSVTSSFTDILEDIRTQHFDVLFIDDADMFGPDTVRLLGQMRIENPACRIVVGVRSTRAFLLDSLTDKITLPQEALTASDVGNLIDVLRRHKAIANRRLSDHDVRRSILETGKGQLLVGMIQATSGLPFAEKIASECAQLDRSELLIYGSLAIASAEKASMTEDEILEAAPGDANEGWSAFKRLLKARLVVREHGTDRFEVRHRVVAEEVRVYLRRRGLLQVAVMNALRAFAAASVGLRSVSNPDRKAFIRLLNHTYLISLQLTSDDVREIYDAVEDLLDDDFHYWLQRGSFEVEAGDETAAMHDLTSAMTTLGGEQDPKVLTEFAYLRLRIARRVRTPEADRLALEGIRDLHSVVRREGVNSPHTFSILAKEGAAWLEDAGLGRSETGQLALETAAMLTLGARLDPVNPEVGQCRQPAISRLESLARDLGAL